MAGIYGYSREAVRVKVKKCEGNLPPEWRKFSVDPQITSLEVLYSILAKAFDLKTDFGISYKAIDPTNGVEVYLSVLSDYDLDAAFLRAHNLSITASSEPCLNLRVDIKPFSEAPDWEAGSGNTSRETSPLQQSLSSGQRYVQTVQNRLPGLIINQMEKTFSMVQRALNLVEDPLISQPPRQPLSDTEFRGFLDSVGQIVHTKELRKVIYIGGIDPSLRRVVWKHILNVYPDGMTGRERMDYMKRKAAEYYRLRDKWKTAVQKGSVVGELAYVTSMVRKDVLRTDRLHPFYAGNDDNQNIAALFNILTTYALNHPAVSYCQGMSDIASPLLVTMGDEAQAYICFCAVMTRLRTNFMLDGIAMTTKFSHLSEALQYYDPEFFEYLKVQQADDLLFCYRWLLLEMKREFAFEDSLHMLEVLWSSLPSTPPIKELFLFEKEFEPPPPETPLPKSPSVILRTPRENPYTKICALRRQSSALSLHSISNTTNSTTPSSGGSAKLDATKRMNQSLDENISRTKALASIKTHQSLDESKMLQHLNNAELAETLPGQVETLAMKDVEPTMKAETLSVNVEINQTVRPRSVSPIKVAESHGGHDSASAEFCGSGVARKGNTRPHHRGLNQISNKTMFNSTGNLISRQIGNKKTGHFKDLKEKIVASKKGIFASLDKIEVMQMPSSMQEPPTSALDCGNSLENGNVVNKKTTKGHKVVKNFNEFLNFASINKSRISDRLSGGGIGSGSMNKKPIMSLEEKLNPLIKLTKSSFDDSDTSSITETPPSSVIESVKKNPLQLQLSSIIIEKQTSFDGSSPDDSQEYFPMTTSMTRELRLELENLDRHVFGTDFHQRTQFSALSGCETPESGDSVDKIPEFIYKKLNQQSIDCFETDSEYGGGSGSLEKTKIDEDCAADICSYPVMNGDVKCRVKPLDYDDNSRAFKRISTSSANNDIFIWENPLHQFSSSPQTIEVEIEPVKPKHLTTTPDEQCDLDYDGEIIEENNLGKKSVTPIRLVRKNGESASNSNRNSILNAIDSDTSESWNENKVEAEAEVETQLKSEHLTTPLTSNNQMTNSCEEASEAQTLTIEVNNKESTGMLPPPKEFGCGNPFLMFLCLTLLLQHRDIVIKSGMDYNEMAMHFDKMVRKHNVTRVLNQARRMFSEYLKSQKSCDSGSGGRSSDQQEQVSVMNVSTGSSSGSASATSTGNVNT